jgi:hypothetical protein
LKCEAKVAIEETPAITSVATPVSTNGAALTFPAAAAGGGWGGDQWGAAAGVGGGSSRMSTSLQYWQRASVTPAANSTGAPQLSQRGSLIRPILTLHRDRKTSAGEAPPKIAAFVLLPEQETRRPHRSTFDLERAAPVPPFADDVARSGSAPVT